MRHFIVITHAYMAKGIVSSLELIAGEQEHLTYYCAYVQEEDFKEKLKQEIDAYDSGDEIIIFTDLFGGSVNNEIMMMLGKRRNLHLLTGMNLALLLGILLADEDDPIEKIINENLEEARNGMIYCNDLIQEEKKSDSNIGLEDF